MNARRLYLFLFLCLVPGLCACASKPSPYEIRSSLSSGNLEGLTLAAEEIYTPGGDFDVSLNLARLYQMQGEWQKSKQAFNDALSILEEYENRAVVNIRAMASDTGMFLFSRGSKGFFGSGHERCLLHTFNALNYLMLGDVNGAAVELRRMEKRQENWLAESEERIRKATEQPAPQRDLGELPTGYSMRSVLDSPEGKAVLSGYQDPFSYALSSSVTLWAGDPDYAEISKKRAVALSDDAAFFFTPPAQEKKKKGKKTSAAAPSEETQEVLFAALAGIGPSLYLEKTRSWMPGIGYLLFELPSYHAPLHLNAPSVRAEDKEIPLYPLLRTDRLAYRGLKDDMPYELSAAVSRATIRAGVAYTAYALAYAHEDTRPFSGLIGGLATVIMDLGAMTTDSNVRNWETLPNAAYLGYAVLPAGAELAVTAGRDTQKFTLPDSGKRVFVLISYITPTLIRIDHAVLN